MLSTKSCQAAGLVILALCVTPAAAAPRAEPDPLTPADADVVLTVNVRQLLQSPLVKKRALTLLQQALTRHEPVQKFLLAAGLDPVRDVERLTITASGNPAHGGRAFAILRGTFDPSKVQSATEEYARDHPQHVKIHKDGGLAVFEVHADRPVYAAFAGAGVLVLSLSREATLSVVRTPARARPATPGPEMQAALGRLTGREDVWMAMAITPALRKFLQGDEQVKELAASLQCVTGSLEVAQDARANVVIYTNDAAAAAQLGKKLDELTPLLGFLAGGKDPAARLMREVLGSLKIAADGKDVRVSFQITDEMIEKVSQPAR
jgi:hypothetical protein